jgi:hypothetical protein
VKINYLPVGQRRAEEVDARGGEAAQPAEENAARMMDIDDDYDDV